MDELLQKVAEIRGMPAPLVERSAEARAKKLGVSTEDVLREWAGEAAPAAPSPSEETATPKADDAAAAPTGGGAITRDELVEQAASAKGMPASLVERSAAARAKKEGLTTEAVLAEWAGVDAATVVAAPPVAAAPDAPAPVPEAPAAVAEAGSRAEVFEPASAEAEAEAEAEEEAAGASSPWSRYPALLTASFIIIPVIAVLYILAIPNGPSCGSSGQLAVDPASGEAVNCDGSEYGVDASDNFGLGGAVYAAQCVACHGAGGGGGAGPALSGGAVLATFPSGSCSDHVSWIGLGSTGWPEATYGATGKPVAGGMPGFESSLSELELAQVSLYERVAFGGEDLMEAEAECGLGEAGEEGEA